MGIDGLTDCLLRPLYYANGYVRFGIIETPQTNQRINYAAGNLISYFKVPIHQILQTPRASGVGAHELNALNLQNFNQFVYLNTGYPLKPRVIFPERLTDVGLGEGDAHYHAVTEQINSNQFLTQYRGYDPMYPFSVSEFDDPLELLNYFTSDNCINLKPGPVELAEIQKGFGGGEEHSHHLLENLLRRIEAGINSYLECNLRLDQRIFPVPGYQGGNDTWKSFYHNQLAMRAYNSLPFAEPLINSVTLGLGEGAHRGNIVFTQELRQTGVLNPANLLHYYDDDAQVFEDTFIDITDDAAPRCALTYIDEIKLAVDVTLGALTRYKHTEKDTDAANNILNYFVRKPTNFYVQAWYAGGEIRASHDMFYNFRNKVTVADYARMAMGSNYRGEGPESQSQEPVFFKSAQYRDEVNGNVGVDPIGNLNYPVPSDEFTYLWLPLPIMKMMRDRVGVGKPNPLLQHVRLILADLEMRYGLKEHQLTQRRMLMDTIVSKDAYTGPNQEYSIRIERLRNYMGLDVNYRGQNRDDPLPATNPVDPLTADELPYYLHGDEFTIARFDLMHIFPKEELNRFGNNFFTGVCLAGNPNEPEVLRRHFTGKICCQETFPRMIRFHCPEIASRQTIKQSLSHPSVLDTRIRTIPVIPGDAMSEETRRILMEQKPFDQTLSKGRETEVFAFLLDKSTYSEGEVFSLRDKMITKIFDPDPSRWIQLYTTELSKLTWWFTDENGRRLYFPGQPPLVELLFKTSNW